MVGGGDADGVHLAGVGKLLIHGCVVLQLANLVAQGERQVVGLLVHGVEIALVLLREPYLYRRACLLAVLHGVVEAADDALGGAGVDVADDGVLDRLQIHLRCLLLGQIHLEPFIQFTTQFVQAVADGDTAAVLAYRCEGGLLSVYFVHNRFSF